MRCLPGLAVCALVVAGCSAAVAGSGIAADHAVRSTAPAAPRKSVVTVTVTPSPSPSLPSFSSLYARERSGVVRIETVGCSDSGVGTGFLVSPTEIVTVAHVVDESVVISLIDGRQRTTGTIEGIDRSRDLALVRAEHPISGFHFTLNDRLPSVGDDVGAIGFPIGDPITFTQGSISGLHRSITVDGLPRHDLIETDAAVNPGNSGGPLIGQDGAVYGLIDAKNIDAEGIAFAVPAVQAMSSVVAWRARPVEVGADCSNPLGPGQAPVAVPDPATLDRATARAVARTFATYFTGIDSGDYASAWATLSPRRRAAASFESFASGDATSYDSDIEVLDDHRIDATTADVALAFTSLQRSDKGPDGDVCDNWTLDYTLVDIAGQWYIDDAQPFAGSTHTSC